ncbi:hypothetical protein ACHAWF_001745, partial [Thalassiosira exigua]
MATTAADNDGDDDAQKRRALTQAQLDAIEEEIKATQPLASPLLPIDALVRQYASTTADGDDGGGDGNGGGGDGNGGSGGDGFARSAAFLARKYRSLRRIRGDGNCYYRAFLYATCESLLASLSAGGGNGDGGEGRAEFDRVKKVASDSLKWACDYGYEEHAIEMFHEELIELLAFLEELAEGGDSDAAASEKLHVRLNEENASSDYCAWYLRVLTAAQMKSDPERYLPFVLAENYGDVSSFCAREVEPVGKECGMVQVAALAKCLGVKATIEYVDG